MKNLYNVFFILFVTSLISCGNKVSSGELTFNGGVAQLKGKPYTGSVFETFANGDIKSEGQLKDGIPAGKFIEYYDNKNIKHYYFPDIFISSDNKLIEVIFELNQYNRYLIVLN